jgi:hypothetical protein
MKVWSAVRTFCLLASILALVNSNQMERLSHVSQFQVLIPSLNPWTLVLNYTIDETTEAYQLVQMGTNR